MTKLQKSSESEVKATAEIERVLDSSVGKLWDGSSETFPFVHYSGPLRIALASVRRNGQLVGGLEAIETLLQKEQTGLQKVQREPLVGERSQVASRLLLLANDGSERFYRSAESMQRRFGRRVLLCRLDVAGEVLGSFFGKNSAVKALLVTRKELVSRVLHSLVSPTE